MAQPFSSSEVIGDIHPVEVIQQDNRACLPACLLGVVDPALSLGEADVIRILTENELYVPGPEGGTGIVSAKVLDTSIQKIGLTAAQVFKPQFEFNDSGSGVEQRLLAVDEALRNGQTVILAYPNRRNPEAPFLHYVRVTGYEVTEDGSQITLVDPSNVDGGTKTMNWREFLPYITPTEELPVSAWGVRRGDIAT